MCIFGPQNEHSPFIMKIKYQKPLVTFHSIHIKLNCEQENDMEPKNTVGTNGYRLSYTQIE